MDDGIGSQKEKGSPVGAGLPGRKDDVIKYTRTCIYYITFQGKCQEKMKGI